MLNLLHFSSKGSVGSDRASQKNLLKTIWFTLYSRGGGSVGSSGFEHIFMNEIKNNEISGLHNWIYFHDQENFGQNNLDYKGYMKSLHLGNVNIYFIQMNMYCLVTVMIKIFISFVFLLCVESPTSEVSRWLQKFKQTGQYYVYWYFTRTGNGIVYRLLGDEKNEMRSIFGWQKVFH